MRCGLYARLRQARRARRAEDLAQVEPPGERETRRVEREIDLEREVRSAGRGNRRTEAARDQVATAGADRTDEPKRRRAFDPRGAHGGDAVGLARALRRAQLLLAEDRRDHPVGRAVADARGDEENQEHHQEAGEILDAHEVHDADRGGAHGDEVPERHDGAADLVGQQAAERTRERAHQRPKERDGDGHLGKLRLDQQRKGRRIADERAECPDIDVGHDPGVLVADDRELVLEGRARRGEVVHEEDRAEHRDRDRKEPHQAGVLEIDSLDRRGLVEVDQADAHQDRRQQLDAAHADVSASCVQSERPALHAVRIEERDVGHARGEVAAAETRKGGGQQHQPERRIRLTDEIGERDGGNEQHCRAEDRPVPAAEDRHRERVGKPHERADQPRQRHELKELVGRVVEAGLRQLGRDNAPDQPDREADMLGHDRPDQIAPGNRFAFGFPVLLILRVPVRDPDIASLAH